MVCLFRDALAKVTLSWPSVEGVNEEGKSRKVEAARIRRRKVSGRIGERREREERRRRKRSSEIDQQSEGALVVMRK